KRFPAVRGPGAEVGWPIFGLPPLGKNLFGSRGEATCVASVSWRPRHDAPVRRHRNVVESPGMNLTRDTVKFSCSPRGNSRAPWLECHAHQLLDRRAALGEKDRRRGVTGRPYAAQVIGARPTPCRLAWTDLEVPLNTVANQTR